MDNMDFDNVPYANDAEADADFAKGQMRVREPNADDALADRLANAVKSGQLEMKVLTPSSNFKTVDKDTGAEVMKPLSGEAYAVDPQSGRVVHLLYVGDHTGVDTESAYMFDGSEADLIG